MRSNNRPTCVNGTEDCLIRCVCVIKRVLSTMRYGER